MSLLRVEGLKKSYTRGFIPKRTQILNGLSFSVPAGSVTGFLAANGAGKTTTMRCVLGLDYPDEGVIEAFGKPMSVEAKRRLGFLPERPFFYEHLSGVEFLEFYAGLSGKWKKADLKARIDELLKRVDLEFAKDRALRAYSKGMLQKIGVAQALIHDPELVILDEPMSGLDPDGRMAINDIIAEIARKGTAVFFTSHLMHDTERICDRLLVMKGGVSIYEGPTEQLLERSGLQYELHFEANGEKRQLRSPDVDSLQIEIKKLVGAGARISEVRRLRSSLEEIFVGMALRGGRNQ